MTTQNKTSKQLERYFKGVANHRRIDILSFVAGHEGVTLDKIATTLHCNMKTISVHTSKLVQAGLMNKKYRGQAVEHSISPYGKKFLSFFKSFE